MLKSILLECSALGEATIPLTNGHLTQALVLNLIRQFDPELSARLHDEPGYRPYTVSPLSGVARSAAGIALQREQRCRIRLTLLDGGTIWQKLCTHFVEAGPVSVRLRSCLLQLVRIVSSPEADPAGWVSATDWQTLFALPPAEEITMHFATATAFSWGGRRFVVFPEPYLLWGGLLQSWNRYATSCYRFARQEMRASLQSAVTVATCSLRTRTLHFTNFTQKGFVGACSYRVRASSDITALLTTLAAFALYAGVGSKTTMGMGQVRATFDDRLKDVVHPDLARVGAETSVCATGTQGE